MADHAGDPGGRDPACELCEAARFTHWYHEDDRCWVADCEACDVPMVVWRRHGTDPGPEVVEHLLARLTEAADGRFGEGRWRLDRDMRQVPDHFHAHARDDGWWSRRASGRVSMFTGIGGERRYRGQ